MSDFFSSKVNSFPASGDFWRLLITFANSLDPDQAQQISDGISERFFWKSYIFKKKSKWQKNIQNYPACKELIRWSTHHQLSSPSFKAQAQTVSKISCSQDFGLSNRLTDGQAQSNVPSHIYPRISVVPMPNCFGDTTGTWLPVSHRP